MSVSHNIRNTQKPENIFYFDDFEHLIFVSMCHDRSDLAVSISSFPPRDFLYDISFEASSLFGYRVFDEDQLAVYFESFTGKLATGLYRTPESEIIHRASEQFNFKPYPKGIRQYLIVTSNKIVEILSFEDPSVEPILGEPGTFSFEVPTSHKLNLTSV